MSSRSIGDKTVYYTPGSSMDSVFAALQAAYENTDPQKRADEFDAKFSYASSDSAADISGGYKLWRLSDNFVLTKA